MATGCPAEIPNYSIAIIQAGFNNKDTTSPTLVPGCVLTAYWAPFNGVIHFKADGCLYGDNGRLFNSKLKFGLFSLMRR